MDFYEAASMEVATYDDIGVKAAIHNDRRDGNDIDEDTCEWEAIYKETSEEGDTKDDTYKGGVDSGICGTAWQPSCQ